MFRCLSSGTRIYNSYTGRFLHSWWRHLYQLSWSLTPGPESAACPRQPALQRDRQVGEGQCLSQVDFAGSWLAGNTHLSTDSTEQLGGETLCSLLFPLVNLGEKWRSDAAEAQPGRAPQTSHQPPRPADKTAADWQLGVAVCPQDRRSSCEHRARCAFSSTVELHITTGTPPRRQTTKSADPTAEVMPSRQEHGVGDVRRKNVLVKLKIFILTPKFTLSSTFKGVVEEAEDEGSCQPAETPWLLTLLIFDYQYLNVCLCSQISVFCSDDQQNVAVKASLSVTILPWIIN